MESIRNLNAGLPFNSFAVLDGEQAVKFACCVLGKALNGLPPPLSG